MSAMTHDQMYLTVNTTDESDSEYYPSNLLSIGFTFIRTATTQLTLSTAFLVKDIKTSPLLSVNRVKETC